MTGKTGRRLRLELTMHEAEAVLAAITNAKSRMTTSIIGSVEEQLSLLLSSMVVGSVMTAPEKRVRETTERALQAVRPTPEPPGAAPVPVEKQAEDLRAELANEDRQFPTPTHRRRPVRRRDKNTLPLFRDFPNDLSDDLSRQKSSQI
jgi:hypothetical protein